LPYLGPYGDLYIECSGFKGGNVVLALGLIYKSDTISGGMRREVDEAGDGKTHIGHVELVAERGVE
jgi:hypothetical protein